MAVKRLKIQNSQKIAGNFEESGYKPAKFFILKKLQQIFRKLIISEARFKRKAN
jgi:alpha-mannosidase